MKRNDIIDDFESNKRLKPNSDNNQVKNKLDEQGWLKLFFSQPDEVVTQQLQHIMKTNNQGYSPYTILEYASRYSKSTEVIKCLIEKLSFVQLNEFLYDSFCNTLFKTKNITKEMVEYFLTIYDNQKAFDTIISKEAFLDNLLSQACVYYPSFEIIEFLIHKGANPISQNVAYKMTPLNYYICNQANDKLNLDVLSLLMKHTKDINLITGTKGNPLANFLYENKNINIEVIKLFIEHLADVNTKCIDNDSNLLQEILLKAECKVETFDWLTNKGADMLYLDKNGANLLHYSLMAKHTNFDLILHLFNQKNFVSLDTNGNSFLHYVCMAQNPNYDAVNFCIKKAKELNYDINTPNNKGYTPLHKALLLQKYDANLLQLLIDNGADINSLNNVGKNSLYVACSNNNVSLETIKFLIEKNADVLNITNNGNTILHSICSRRNNKFDIVDFLLKQGIDINKQNDQGLTALMFSVENRLLKTISHLINNKADVNILDNNGENVLMQSITYHQGYLDENGLLNADYLETIKLLVKNTDLEQCNSFGANALILSTIDTSMSTTKILIESGADINLAIIKCCLGDLPDDLNILIKNGGHVDYVYNGFTPIMIACFYNLPNIVEILLKNGAETSIVLDSLHLWNDSIQDLLKVHVASRKMITISCYDKEKSILPFKEFCDKNIKKFETTIFELLYDIKDINNLQKACYMLISNFTKFRDYKLMEFSDDIIKIVDKIPFLFFSCLSCAPESNITQFISEDLYKFQAIKKLYTDYLLKPVNNIFYIQDLDENNQDNGCSGDSLNFLDN